VTTATRPTALLGEIDRLVDANRTAPSAANERRIVELRHAAFGELRARPGGELPIVESVEPATETPHPDDLVLDVIDAPALRTSLLRYGAALLPGVVALGRVDELTNGIDRAFEAFDTTANGEASDDDLRWYAPFDPPGARRLRQDRGFNRNGGGIWATDSPRLHFLLVETLREAGVTQLVADYFGEPPAVSVNKSTLRRVPSDARNGDWHQDGAFLGEGIRTINAWMCLSECGLDAPGLDFVPRRLELAPTGTQGAHFDWAVAPAVVDEVRHDVAVLRPRFRPGDILLFDHLFLHRTATTPSMTEQRYAVETWFFAPSRYPDTQYPIAL
jgi:Phytanoyl-CoA dioxygenase (PhyH)